MENPTFNLVDRPWIGALTASGEVREFTLREIFAQSNDVRELHDESPLIVVALLRVLLAIVMASAPWREANPKERRQLWRQWWQTRSLPLEQIDAYLSQWRGRFDLFDAQLPWMQTGQLEMKKSDAVARLSFEELLSGVFSFPENSVWQAPTPALAARLLLGTQNFALGFGKSSVATIGGGAVEPPYSADAPLLRGLTIWHSGATLCETLLLNLVPSERMDADKPSWELDAPHQLRDELVRGQRNSHAVRGPMDAFTLHARLLRLLPETQGGEVVVPRVFFTQGRSLGKGENRFYDPMKLYLAGKDGYLPLALSENKAAWRDSHALFRAAAKDKLESPGIDASRWLAINVEAVSSDYRNRINIVGLATEPGKAGNFLLSRYDRFTVPLTLLRDEERINQIEVALREVEAVGQSLGARFRVVARLFLAPDCDLPNAMQPDKKNVNNLCDAFDPRRAFWPRLEERFERYLNALVAAQTPQQATEAWLDEVEREAKQCFVAARNELGQQFRSYRTASVSDGFFAPERAKQKSEQKTNPPTNATAPPVQNTSDQMAIEF